MLNEKTVLWIFCIFFYVCNCLVTNASKIKKKKKKKMKSTNARFTNTFTSIARYRWKVSNFRRGEGEVICVATNNPRDCARARWNSSVSFLKRRACCERGEGEGEGEGQKGLTNLEFANTGWIPVVESSLPPGCPWTRAVFSWSARGSVIVSGLGWLGYNSVLLHLIRTAAGRGQ